MGMLAFIVQIQTKEVHRHRTVKIESLAMYIFLDSEEVCVMLENGLTERMISSICFSQQEFLIAHAFRNFHGEQLWHP